MRVIDLTRQLSGSVLPPAMHFFLHPLLHAPSSQSGKTEKELRRKRREWLVSKHIRGLNPKPYPSPRQQTARGCSLSISYPRL